MSLYSRLKSKIKPGKVHDPLTHIRYTRDEYRQLHDAASARDLDRLKTLLQEDYFRSCIYLQKRRSWWCRLTPLGLAARRDHADCLAYLITMGAQVDIADDNNCTPFFWAVDGHGDLTCVRILLEAGADPNNSVYDCNILVYRAAFEGRLDILQELIRAHPTIHMDYSPPLYLSARRHNLDCFRLLLQAAGVLICDVASSLLLAVLRFRCDAAFVQLLLDHGADPSLVTWEQAELEGDPGALRVFLEAKRGPRSLAHICRIQIRQVLGTHRLNQVQSLPLTQVTKDFLLHQN